MKLLSIQVAEPSLYGKSDAADPMDREWTTGFYKETVGGPVHVSWTGLAGDGQADLKNHGGRDKAICVYSKDHWAYWETVLDRSLPHGAFGENLTIRGATEEAVCVGDTYRCGTVVVQVSQPRQPCWKLARRWRIKDLAAQVEKNGKTGWYFRVLQEGAIEAEDDLPVLERPYPEWPLSLANEIMHHRKDDSEGALALASCPALSESWQTSLLRRAETLHRSK